MRLRMAAVCALGVALCFVPALARQAATPKPPTLTVDKLWPKPLPNHWVYGSITGLAVEKTGHFFWAFAVCSIVVLLGAASYAFLMGPVKPVTWPETRP